MIKLIKQSFELTNKYIVLATPLILFSLLSSLYIIFSVKSSLISLIFSITLFFLMLGAFVSGWFYMISKCFKEEADPNGLILDFPAGVGEYFLPALGMITIVFITGFILFMTAFTAGIFLIGDIGIPADSISKAMVSVPALKAFLESLTSEQLVKLNAWNILLMLTMLVNYFVIMFYPPAMFLKNRNPLFAFGNALKDLFSRKFLTNILLFIIITVLYFILSVFTAFSSVNFFSNFLMTLINFYLMVYIFVLIFNYYYTNFVQIGGNIDTRV